MSAPIPQRYQTPQVGDCLIGLDGNTSIEVKGIVHGQIQFTYYITGSVVQSQPHHEFLTLIRSMLPDGHTFNAVEDDEE